MNVLVACECSGIVRQAFRMGGHNAWSCDLQPDEHGSEYHVQCDARDLLSANWDLLIAHPPCDYIANSGVQFLEKEPGRRAALVMGCALFTDFLRAPVPLVCVENPIPHRYGLALIGRKYDQLIQPYHFGHPERKATCLWLKGLPRLAHTEDVRAEMAARPKKDAQRIHYMSPGPDRKRERSRTFQGIARAMADQWGAKKELDKS